MLSWERFLQLYSEEQEDAEIYQLRRRKEVLHLLVSIRAEKDAQPKSLMTHPFHLKSILVFNIKV